MTAPRIATAVLGAGRIGYSLALLIAPKVMARPWVGKRVKQPSTRMLVRGIGVRDLVVGGGMLAAGLTGTAVRPALAAATVIDLGDVIESFVAAEDLPPKAPEKVLAVGGGSALANLAVMLLPNR